MAGTEDCPLPAADAILDGEWIEQACYRTVSPFGAHGTPAFVRRNCHSISRGPDGDLHVLETSVAGPCGTGEADTTHSEISRLVRGRKCLAADERQRLLEAAAGPPERQSWILSRYVWRQRALPGGANSAIRHHASILRMFQQHSIAIACYKTVQETANRILLQQRHDTAAPVDFHFTIGSILYRRPLTAVAPEADFHFTQGTEVDSMQALGGLTWKTGWHGVHIPYGVMQIQW